MPCIFAMLTLMVDSTAAPLATRELATKYWHMDREPAECYSKTNGFIEKEQASHILLELLSISTALSHYHDIFSIYRSNYSISAASLLTSTTAIT